MASKWSRATLSTLVSSLEAGVSVNSNDRPPNTGELGVLKTSAISGGTFNPNESKTVLPAERSRVCTCVTAKGIIVSRMNTPELVGESALVDDDFPNLFLPDRLWLMMVQDERCQARWLSHFLRSSISRRFIAVSATGTSGSMKNLPKPRFLAMPVDVPPLPEQRAIAAVLDTIDDAIQKTEQIIAKLQQVKQGLLHDLLTRGIDDNGELRDPDRHPEQFQDSPLGKIPKGWRAESLRSLVTSAVDGPFGSALKSEHYVPQPGVRLVRLQNIGSGEFIDHDHAWISQRYAETLRRHDAVSGDVLVASLGDENHPYGRACVFQDGSWAIVKADCFRLRPTGFMNSDFLAASLNIDVYHRPLRGLAQGVTRDRVNLGNLLRVRLPVPSREEQNSLINMVDSLQRRITCEQNRAQKLRSTKAGLSEDLLSGRVRTTSLPGFSA